MHRIKIAVLVSGGGTNLQAVLDAQKNGIIQNGEVALVISNKEGAYALERAAAAGVPTVTITKKNCGSAEAFEKKIIDDASEFEAYMNEHGFSKKIQIGEFVVTNTMSYRQLANTLSH